MKIWRVVGIKADLLASTDGSISANTNRFKSTRPWSVNNWISICFKSFVWSLPCVFKGDVREPQWCSLQAHVVIVDDSSVHDRNGMIYSPDSDIDKPISKDDKEADRQTSRYDTLGTESARFAGPLALSWASVTRHILFVVLEYVRCRCWCWSFLGYDSRQWELGLWRDKYTLKAWKGELRRDRRPYYYLSYYLSY